MKRSFFVTLILAGTVAVCFGFTQDEPKYKNLKILPKNITKHQLDSVMNHFTASLGVKCNFCHVRNEETKTWDHASDENKHKLVARNMMKMTKKINDKYFDVVKDKNDPLSSKLLVTCYTCHNGKADPAVNPPARQRNQQSIPADTTRRN